MNQSDETTVFFAHVVFSFCFVILLMEIGKFINN